MKREVPSVAPESVAAPGNDACAPKKSGGRKFVSPMNDATKRFFGFR